MCMEAGREGGGWQNEGQYEKLLEVETDLCLNLEEIILTIEIPSGDQCKASLATQEIGDVVGYLLFPMF